MDPNGTKFFPKYAVINADDPSAEKMISDVKVPILRFRLHAPASPAGKPTDLFTKNLICDATGSRFELKPEHRLHLVPEHEEQHDCERSD